MVGVVPRGRNLTSALGGKQPNSPLTLAPSFERVRCILMGQWDFGVVTLVGRCTEHYGFISFIFSWALTIRLRKLFRSEGVSKIRKPPLSALIPYIVSSPLTT